MVAAAAAIRVALSAGTGPLAVEVWKSFQADREALALEPAALETLARQLTTRKDWNDAGWCLRAMKARGGDPIRVQKGLIAVADAIARDGSVKRAGQVFRFILTEFPDSPLRDYIEGAISQLERKAASGGGKP